MAKFSDFFQHVGSGLFGKLAGRSSESLASAREEQMKVLKKGSAMRVIFFYPGEEGTYVDNSDVTLYENGIVHIRSNQEETTTHLQNCEILWHFEIDATEERVNKVRLLKPKSETSLTAKASEEASNVPSPDDEGGDKPTRKKSPELR